MEVLSYQLFFLCIIVLSSLFGRSIRNWIVLLSVVFTLIAIFTSGLMILQLFTISIAYGISEKIYSSYDKEELEDTAGAGCLWFFVLIVFFVLHNLYGQHYLVIILFQIPLFFFITYIGYISRLRLNIISIISFIFTYAVIKATPLMFLQFATIILAYTFVRKKGTLDEK